MTYTNDLCEVLKKPEIYREETHKIGSCTIY